MNLTAEIVLAHRLADAARAAIRPHFREPVATDRKHGLILNFAKATLEVKRVLAAPAPLPALPEFLSGTLSRRVD